jgi:hypothetical protein
MHTHTHTHRERERGRKLGREREMFHTQFITCDKLEIEGNFFNLINRINAKPKINIIFNDKRLNYPYYKE